MKKKFLLLFILIILSGCSSQYNIKITSDQIEENIYLEIDKSMIETYVSDEVEPDDQIMPFINGKQYPFLGNYSKTYNKEVTEDDSYYYVALNYSFTPENYGESVAISGCFENYEYINDDDYYEINLSGSFYCLYGDSLEINISTPNVVDKNNAMSKSGDTYTWVIDSSNVDDVEISIKVLKQTKVSYYGIRLFLGLFAIVVVMIAIFIFVKVSNRKNVNEI